jgi:hypothetical protein
MARGSVPVLRLLLGHLTRHRVVEVALHLEVQPAERADPGDRHHERADQRAARLHPREAEADDRARERDDRERLDVDLRHLRLALVAAEITRHAPPSAIAPPDLQPATMSAPVIDDVEALARRTEEQEKNRGPPDRYEASDLPPQRRLLAMPRRLSNRSRRWQNSASSRRTTPRPQRVERPGRGDLLGGTHERAPRDPREREPTEIKKPERSEPVA